MSCPLNFLCAVMEPKNFLLLGCPANCLSFLMEIKSSSLLSVIILNQLNPIKFWEDNFSKSYSLTYAYFLSFIWFYNFDFIVLIFSLHNTYCFIYSVPVLHKGTDLTHSTQFA